VDAEGEHAAFLQQPLTLEEHSLGGAQEPHGDAPPYEKSFYSKFAGILQAESRQRVSEISMLITIFCEGSMQ
jgi:hypothetical protein